MLLEALEQGIGSVDGLQVGTSVLTRVCLLDFSAISIRDVLRAIADAQHRHFAHKAAQVYLEGFGVVNAVWRSAQDYSYHLAVVFRIFVVRQNLAERVKLSHTAAYELSGLRTEIKDYYLLLHEL